MAKIKAANPQVLIAWAAGTPGGNLLHAEFEAGIDVPTLTSPANLNYNQLKDQWSSFLPTRLIFPGSAAVVRDAATTHAWKTMTSTFIAALGSGVTPDQVHASGWDPPMLAVETLRKLGPDPTAAQIRDRIAQTKSWTGVFGLYDFTAIPQRGVGVSSVIMVEWNKTKNDHQT